MKVISWWYNPKIRANLFQLVLVFVVFGGGYQLFTNLQENLAVRGVAGGFGFLDNTAGFDIIVHLIDYNESSSYGRAFFVGLLNTLLVAFIGIIFATIIGFFVGVSRLSHNPLVNKLSFVYIELTRNIPLLLQLFFWYFIALRALPIPRESMTFLDIAFLNNRGLSIPWPTSLLPLCFLILSIWLSFCIGLMYYRKKAAQKIQSGQEIKALPLLIGFLALISISLFAWVYFSSWSVPELQGFNYSGGVTIIPEFMALCLGLTLYTAAFIAEIVRSGILAIDKGQWEAAKALGLSSSDTITKIIIPQALKIILPPLTNQYLNLTKNSSLAAAIAYPDLVAVFAGTVLNQTGQAVEIIAITMGVYLSISLSISFVMSQYEKRTRWGAQG